MPLQQLAPRGGGDEDLTCVLTEIDELLPKPGLEVHGDHERVVVPGLVEEDEASPWGEHPVDPFECRVDVERVVQDVRSQDDVAGVRCDALFKGIVVDVEDPIRQAGARAVDLPRSGEEER